MARGVDTGNEERHEERDGPDAGEGEPTSPRTTDAALPVAGEGGRDEGRGLDQHIVRDRRQRSKRRKAREQRELDNQQRGREEADRLGTPEDLADDVVDSGRTTRAVRLAAVVAAASAKGRGGERVAVVAAVGRAEAGREGKVGDSDGREGEGREAGALVCALGRARGVVRCRRRRLNTYVWKILKRRSTRLASTATPTSPPANTPKKTQRAISDFCVAWAKTKWVGTCWGCG